MHRKPDPAPFRRTIETIANITELTTALIVSLCVLAYSIAWTLVDGKSALVDIGAELSIACVARQTFADVAAIFHQAFRQLGMAQPPRLGRTHVHDYTFSPVIIPCEARFAVTFVRTRGVRAVLVGRAAIGGVESAFIKIVAPKISFILFIYSIYKTTIC